MSGEDVTPEDRRAAARAYRERSVQQRDGSEPIGVMAHPEPAERRQEPTREDMSHMTEDPWKTFQRRGRETRSSSFDIPVRYQKPGFSYQWITISVFNQPETSTVRTMEYDGGWRQAKAKDFPEMVLSGTPPDGPVELDGQRLYIRPKWITDEAKQEDMLAAQDQMRNTRTAAAAGRSANKSFGEALAGRVGVRAVPMENTVETLAGGGTGRGM